MINSARCLYNKSFEDFIIEDSNVIFGILCDNYHGDAVTSQREAWKEEIIILKNLVSELGSTGQVIFEYDIPRLGKRIDAVVLTRGIIFCLEFKVGESKILECDVDQVLDYALDLKHFHKFSQDKIIAPILIATNYKRSSTEVLMSVYNDKVINPLVCGKDGINVLVDKVISHYPNESEIDANWVISPYAPTPTIIEAARTLYESHSVENITRHEADNVSTDRNI